MIDRFLKFLLRLLPQGGGMTPALEQEHFRIRDDTTVPGSGGTPNWISTEDQATNIVIDRDVTFRFRVVIANTGDANTGQAQSLYYRKNQTGAFATVGSNTPVQHSAAASTASDETVLTATGDFYLTAGTGTAIDGIYNESGDAGVRLSGGEYTELEFGLVLDGSQLDAGDTIELRVYQNDGTAPTAVDNEPLIEVSSLVFAAATVNVSADVDAFGSSDEFAWWRLYSAVGSGIPTFSLTTGPWQSPSDANPLSGRDPLSGNLLIAIASIEGVTADHLPTLTGWTIGGTHQVGGNTNRWWWKISAGNENPVSISWNTGATATLAVMEYSGGNFTGGGWDSSPLDKTASNTTTAATSHPTGTTATQAAADNFAWASINATGAYTSWVGFNNSFVNQLNLNVTGDHSIATLARVLSSTAAISCTGDSTGQSISTNNFIATFKRAAGGTVTAAATATVQPAVTGDGKSRAFATATVSATATATGTNIARATATVLGDNGSSSINLGFATVNFIGTLIAGGGTQFASATSNVSATVTAVGTGFVFAAATATVSGAATATGTSLARATATVLGDNGSLSTNLASATSTSSLTVAAIGQSLGGLVTPTATVNVSSFTIAVGTSLALATSTSSGLLTAGGGTQFALATANVSATVAASARTNSTATVNVSGTVTALATGIIFATATSNVSATQAGVGTSLARATATVLGDQGSLATNTAAATVNVSATLTAGGGTQFALATSTVSATVAAIGTDTTSGNVNAAATINVSSTVVSRGTSRGFATSTSSGLVTATSRTNSTATISVSGLQTGNGIELGRATITALGDNGSLATQLAKATITASGDLVAAATSLQTALATINVSADLAGIGVSLQPAVATISTSGEVAASGIQRASGTISVAGDLAAIGTFIGGTVTAAATINVAATVAAIGTDISVTTATATILWGGGDGSSGDWTFIGNAQNGLVSQSPTITHGLTLQEGDFLLAFVHLDAVETIVPVETGWTEELNVRSDATETSQVAIFWRRCTGSEPATFDWNQAFDGNWRVLIKQYRPPSPKYFPTVDLAATHQLEFASSSMPCNAGNGETISAKGLSFKFGGKDNRSISSDYSNASNSYTNVLGSNNDQATASADRIFPTGGTIPTTLITGAGGLNDPVYSSHIAFTADSQLGRVTAKGTSLAFAVSATGATVAAIGNNVRFTATATISAFGAIDSLGGKTIPASATIIVGAVDQPTAYISLIDSGTMYRAGIDQNSNLTLDRPLNYSADDLLIVIINGTGQCNLHAQAGWTQLYAPQATTAAYYRWATNDANDDFTLATLSNFAVAAQMLAFDMRSGFYDQITFVQGGSNQAGDSSFGTEWPAAGITAYTANDQTLLLSQHFKTTNVIQTPTDVDDSALRSALVADEVGSGSIGYFNGTATVPGGNRTSWAGATYAVANDADGPAIAFTNDYIQESPQSTGFEVVCGYTFRMEITSSQGGFHPGFGTGGAGTLSAKGTVLALSAATINVAATIEGFPNSYTPQLAAASIAVSATLAAVENPADDIVPASATISLTNQVNASLYFYADNGRLLGRTTIFVNGNARAEVSKVTCLQLWAEMNVRFSMSAIAPKTPRATMIVNCAVTAVLPFPARKSIDLYGTLRALGRVLPEATMNLQSRASSYRTYGLIGRGTINGNKKAIVNVPYGSIQIYNNSRGEFYTIGRVGALKDVGGQMNAVFFMSAIGGKDQTRFATSTSTVIGSAAAYGRNSITATINVSPAVAATGTVNATATATVSGSVTAQSFSVFVIRLDDETVIDRAYNNGTAEAGFYIEPDGLAYRWTTDFGKEQTQGDWAWIRPTAAAGPPKQVRATQAGGSTITGPLGSWLDTDTQRFWFIQVTAGGTKSAQLLLEFSDDGGATILDSATITLSARSFPGDIP